MCLGVNIGAKSNPPYRGTAPRRIERWRQGHAAILAEIEPQFDALGDILSRSDPEEATQGSLT